MVFDKLKSLFGAGAPSLPKVLSPEQEKAILKKGSDAERLALASREDARPEVLYYLADDSSPAVRKQIAHNASTPVQADEILAGDQDDDVRAELVRKIGRMLPTLDEGSQAALGETTISILEKLAQDQLPKIRAMVSEEIKLLNIVPKSVVDKLARDAEEIVCGPVLAYSPLLNEDDLREIIAAGASSGALKAIASRSSVSADVSSDIAATLDVPAITALLTNANAQVREETLDQIIEQAESVEDLHKPLALRPQLSMRAMKRIAGFVASALVHAMVDQSELDEEQAEGLLDRVRERLSDERVGDDEEAQLAAQALEFYERGVLDDKFILQQVEDNRRELIIQCLAVLSDVPAANIRKIIHSKSGRAVTALVWKAGLKMRTAYELQTRFALVPTSQLLSAKDGVHYPLDEDELDWHLSYFVDQQD